MWGEIQEWISNWQPDPFKIIVKPMDSAGSDDVTLCRSIDEVKAAFGNIMGKVNGLGIVNKVLKSPLLQCMQLSGSIFLAVGGARPGVPGGPRVRGGYGEQGRGAQGGGHLGLRS